MFLGMGILDIQFFVHNYNFNIRQKNSYIYLKIIRIFEFSNVSDFETENSFFPFSLTDIFEFLENELLVFAITFGPFW